MSKRYGTLGDLVRSMVSLNLSGEPKDAWKAEALCAAYVGEEDLWFSEDTHVAKHAKAICAECPVRAECLAAAIENREQWGVWGGLATRQRMELYPRDERHVPLRTRQCRVCSAEFTSPYNGTLTCEEHRTTRKRRAAA